MSIPFEIFREQREIGVGLEHEQDTKPMPLVRGQCFDRRGDGDRSDDGVALMPVPALVADSHRHAVRAPRLRPGHLHLLVVRASAIVGPEISQTRLSTDASRSTAICGRLTARIVIVLATQKVPKSTTAVTIQA